MKNIIKTSSDQISQPPRPDPGLSAVTFTCVFALRVNRGVDQEKGVGWSSRRGGIRGEQAGEEAGEQAGEEAGALCSPYQPGLQAGHKGSTVSRPPLAPPQVCMLLISSTTSLSETAPMVNSYNEALNGAILSPTVTGRGVLFFVLAAIIVHFSLTTDCC